jgi:hypothetical protein
MENPESTLEAVSPSPATGNGAAAEAQSSKVGTSRANGATGPRTTQGKERSKRNALKHGIFSQVALLKGESRAEYDALLNSLRENLQPEGGLEELLVEKLARSAWRLRRMIIAETAEIQKAIEFLGWESDQQQAERANNISEYSIRYQGGLVRQIANPEALERCLELLQGLREGIEADGFDPKADADILTKLYGEPARENWQRTLFYPYRTWSAASECTEDNRLQRKLPKPEKCKENFLSELDGEIKRLERYKKARASVEFERMQLEALRQQVPLTPQFDHLLRYEASLERNFDRTLSQLERVQRMRLGQPVLPKLEVHHSLS